VSEIKLDPENVNYGYVHGCDRAALLVTTVLAPIGDAVRDAVRNAVNDALNDALNDPELRAYLANAIRDAFSDIVADVFNDRSPPSGEPAE
jgi:hypothetical protein